ncbi:hypothetical protein SORBI_3002G363433 [Sorghum bicolor]|uniref:Uncharacterized protein n=1 Tax=Sorghum bicolor TaxID=4558 RepID=A0A1W0W704_SORBI|nr:hypothetical protein SORBI_3002G363433 [Sorghum bicolor]
MEIVPHGRRGGGNEREVTEEKMTLRRAWRSESWTCMHQDARYMMTDNRTNRGRQEGTRPAMKMPTQSTGRGASHECVRGAPLLHRWALMPAHSPWVAAFWKSESAVT